MAEASDVATVSVVIPCHDAAPWLRRAMDSVVAQGLSDVEVILVDDGSTDDTLAVARAGAQAFGPGATVLTGPNRGACHARNRGLAAAQGRYVTFLDADDAHEGALLSGAVETAEAEEADLVFSALERRIGGETARVTDAIHAPVDAHAVFRNWLRGWQVNPAAMLWRRTFLERIGGWNEAVLLNQDAELVYRALFEGARLAKNIRGRGVYHDDNAGSLSRRKSEAKLLSLAAWQGAALAKALEGRFRDDTDGLRESLYGVARMAFRMDAPRAGRAALAALRATGDRRHYGGAAHVAVARLVGLETKVRLWGS